MTLYRCEECEVPCELKVTQMSRKPTHCPYGGEPDPVWDKADGPTPTPVKNGDYHCRGDLTLFRKKRWVFDVYEVPVDD